MARLVLAAALVVCVTACSSSNETTTASSTTSSTVSLPAKSPITIKSPVPNSQWRSPITVKGISGLSGKLTVEVLDAAGKQLGSAQTSGGDGRFSVAVPFTAKKLIPGAVLVHDQDSSHSVQVSVVLTP